MRLPVRERPGIENPEVELMNSKYCSQSAGGKFQVFAEMPHPQRCDLGEELGVGAYLSTLPNTDWILQT